MTMPIIRLEVERMKHSIATALTQYQAELDADIHRAVEAYCTPANIARVLQEATQATLDRVIREEVDKFFRFGEGRHVVAAAVRESLLAKTTYTPLDEP